MAGCFKSVCCWQILRTDMRIDVPMSAFFVPIIVILVEWISCSQSQQYARNSYFTIGAMLSRERHQAFFNETIDNLNFDSQYVKKGVTFGHSVIEINPNPIRTALSVCESLIVKGVYAIIVSHELSGDIATAAVSYTCGFYHIPVIGTTSRDSALSDKNIHVSFIRTVPPYSHQADVWVEILHYFNYVKVIFIHSSDTDGRALLGRFQSTSQTLRDDTEIRIEVEYILEFEPGLTDFKMQLGPLEDAQSRVYLLYASAEDATIIFQSATDLNMTRTGYVWLVTEQALTSKKAPKGTLGLKLISAEDQESHISDSLHILISAIREMNETEVIGQTLYNCDDPHPVWETGRKFLEFIKRQTLDFGATGRVSFDENGDRIYAEYEIMNLDLQNTLRPVGRYAYSPDHKTMSMVLNESIILWPGGVRTKPEGFLIPTHLTVLTLEEKPFVYARRSTPNGCHADEILCPYGGLYQTTGPQENLCCKGYCVDLLKELAKTINFTYSLFLSPDGHFGSQVHVSNDTDKKEWTGMIGEIVHERADMIVAPLTINPERAEYIEFSKPFKYQGITILEKKPSRSSTLVSFLQPFSNTLWILVMVSVHVVALVLYLLDRFSPFGRFKNVSTDLTEEDALNLSSAIWFAWGVLLNSGIGEGTPRSFSARVLGMVWAGFAMIIVASYTANLAAFLVLERPKTKLSGINDARLRNTMENLTCATVKGSAVDMYFRRQVELSNMYRTMEVNNYETAEEAIQDVKTGKLMAFIWDSSRLEFEAAQDCELVTAGELFGRSGYGIGMRKRSPWIDAVTLAILDFHESGFIESLDNSWIMRGNIQQCEQFEKTPNTLGLKNMAGVFILVGAGIIGGILLIIIEMAYKKHQIMKQKRIEIVRHATDRWKCSVQMKRKVRTCSRLGADENSVGDAVSVSFLVDRTEELMTQMRSNN